MLTLSKASDARLDADGALRTGRHGEFAYVVREYAGPPLRARKMKQSRDRFTPAFLAAVIVIFALSAIVIGYLWYYNISHQPLRRR
jgi:hypothetical protein